MAFEAEKGHLFSALAALLGALLIQIGTNLSNDYFDFVKGAFVNNRIDEVAKIIGRTHFHGLYCID